MTNSTAAKLKAHGCRQRLAQALSGTNREKLARIQTLPLFEVAMDGVAAVRAKRPFVSNLPKLRKAA